jgi:microcystin degradation protein MlrC
MIGLRDLSGAGHRPPRIALGGFFIECNRWSPSTGAERFRQGFDAGGDALLAELRSPATRLQGDSLGFAAAMDQSGPWELVPLRMAGAEPGGPADHAYFESFCANLEARLKLAGQVDGVFLSLHGAALTTREDDPDGALLARLRARLGPSVPIVAVMDLHANVSARMCDSLSALVAYRTNPHVDLFERGQEAARLLRGMLIDGPGVVERVQLPLVPSATSQLIAPGTVYADLVAQGQQSVGGDILNVSICGGFALADAAKCGMTVSVTARAGQREAAKALAVGLAAQVWAARERFTSRLTPLPEAVAAALAAGRDEGPPVMLADVGDNPGGGGSGNTVGLLQALVEAGVERTVLGVFTDPSLARHAHAVGVGGYFEARFNQVRTGDFAQPWRHRAQVLALGDGRFMGRRGLVQGTQRDMGPCALLQVGGVQVAVISLRQQLIDPAQLEVLGVDLAQARVLVAKSRGHFRAAFEGFANPKEILEVDCPGMTTSNLRALTWTRLPRPVFPIDEDASWERPAA